MQNILSIILILLIIIMIYPFFIPNSCKNCEYFIDGYDIYSDEKQIKKSYKNIKIMPSKKIGYVKPKCEKYNWVLKDYKKCIGYKKYREHADYGIM